MTDYKDPIGECRFELCGTQYKANFGQAKLARINRVLRQMFGPQANAQSMALASYELEALDVFIAFGTDESGYKKLEIGDTMKQMDRHCMKNRQAWRDIWNPISTCITRVYWGDDDEDEIPTGESGAAEA